MSQSQPYVTAWKKRLAIQEKLPTAGAIKILKAEIGSDLRAAKHLSSEAADLYFAKNSPRPNETIYATALLLHHFYSSVEAALERIAKVLSIRPAVLTDATRSRLDEYRRFRHVVRHAYDNPIQEVMLTHLMYGLSLTMSAIENEILSFTQFLDDLAANL